MLAYYYQLKIKPNKPADVGFLRLKKHQLSTMRKQVLHFYLLLLLSLVGYTSAQAQTLSLTLSSPTICLGDQLSLDAALAGLPAGVTATNCTFDFNNDGTVETTIPNGGPNYNTQYLYSAAGNYTIKAEANLSNGAKVSSLISVIVYRLPIPRATVNGQPIQCFRNNLVTLTNASIRTDNRIYRAEIIWGDGNVDLFPFPSTGQNYSHSFNMNGQFNITVKVVDSVGCSKDTTYAGLLTIKPNITPSFNVLGSAGCTCTPFMFQNTTTQVPFALVNSYTWDFGDGKKLTRKRPWKLPMDSLNYDTVWHTYCKNGTFLPSLTIEDTTGCIDSLRYTNAMTVNKPRNIIVELNPRPFLDLADEANGYSRDSVCYDIQGLKTLLFVQDANPEINAGAGEILWNFGDPNSGPANVNNNSWKAGHEFTAIGPFNINLEVWPLKPNPACRIDTTFTIEVLGPRARIVKPTPPPPVILDPTEQNQCAPQGDYYKVINFVNTSEYYKSEHVFTRWDFGDDVAPQCTSYLVPKTGWPQPGGWTSAQQMYANSDGYWRQGGKVFEGRRLDCRYSADTLPVHRYTSWDKVYNWYRYGHDFMPWNPQQYSTNPADTLPTANPRKTLVHPDDTMYWGKPVYLNPVTGVWSLTQGNGPAPYGLWPRIDTIESVDENGQPNPQDLRPYNRFTLQNGAPDPIAGFWGNTKRGGYGFFPKGYIVDPLNDTLSAKYTSIQGQYFKYPYDTMVDATRTLYRFMFDKAVQRCHTVTLFLRDSLNNIGERGFLVAEDLGGKVGTEYTFSSATTTYTPITGGTVISTSKIDDDERYAPLPIGFGFNYNGGTYTDIGINSNGFITLGGLAENEKQTVLAESPRTIAAFAGDLQGKGLPDSDIRVEVLGVAPSRTCVIQWSNFARYPYDIYQKDVFNFQIRLNEDGSIKVAYGNNFAFDTIKEKSYTVGVGINGDTTSDFNARSGNSFVSSVAATINTEGILMSETVLPPAGLTYTWEQPPMTFVSATAVQNTDSVDRGSKERLILNIKVVTDGGKNPLPITEFILNANGSTNTADITKAKLYYTGRSKILHLSKTVFDSSLNLSGNFTLRDTVFLNSGENNFWLVYDITDSAAVDNIVDAEFVSLTVDGVSRTPLVSAPAGGRKIHKSDLQVFNKEKNRLDCEDEDQVQLKLMRPDAMGLGIQGKECPGSFFNPDQAGIRFMLGNVDNVLGQYPGISPDCGAAWIRINLDSMADRRDQTPCALDGFINYTGNTGPSPQAGGAFSTTPGGLTYPPFSLNPDYNQFFMPPNRWNDPAGTFFWYHYGTNTFPLEQSPVSGVTFIPPANPTGDITIGLIVGTGDPNNPCLSDTVWYHNLLNITDLDGRFYVDPVYAPLTNLPSNGVCKYYCKNDMVNFVYLDSVQSFIHSSTIDWGDNSVTVDSFYYSPKPGLTDGYFVNGFRRVRYNYYFGICGDKAIGDLIDSIPFPNGLPGVNVSVRHIDNYTMRIYDPVNNPNGSLQYVGPVATNDSTIWIECGKQFTVAHTDTISVFYRSEELDPAKMLLPVQHKYWASSYEADCKKPGSAPRPVRHQLMSTKECKKQEADSKLLVRGVIDSVMTRDANGNFDNVFCKNEPVHFYDSVRYYRKDCSLSHPIFNPNFDPNTNTFYDNPFNAYHYDTINYWRNGSLNTNDFYPNGDYVEKIKYYFGDGDSAMWSDPIHQYKNPGTYIVTMLSRDKNGCWDTAHCTVYVSEPNAIPVVKAGTYNCGDAVTFYDRSNVTPISGFPNNPYDSLRFEPNIGSGNLVNKNFWHFGENKLPPIPVDARYIDTPVWNYRGNGFFQVMLVVESAQGCLDTGYTSLHVTGPRPYFDVLTPTTGCAPLTVKVVNLADVFGAQGPLDRPTKRTDFLWGDANQQSSVSLNQYDTLTFTYNDSGTFYIFARSDDNNPQSDNNGCKIVYYPDTINGANAPIRIDVRRSYPAEIEIDKQVVCVDQPFTVTNKSDTISYTEFKYEMFNEDNQLLIDSIIKNNVDNKFTYTFADTGSYSVRLTPTQVAPGLPFCRLFDTLPVRVVKPFASFTIDSADVPVFKFRNTSVSSNEYTWTASKNGSLLNQVDKVESDKDWSFDFGTDTGDVVICLQAFTQDPAKPDCMDSVCQTISYRFVVEFKIYNVFTPNTSPGVNDFFDIDIKGETLYDLVIYNRWGTKVFESKSSGYDWNGTNMNDGSDCPEGTYFYVFKYELLNGKKETVNGTVTLIRE